MNWSPTGAQFDEWNTNERGEEAFHAVLEDVNHQRDSEVGGNAGQHSRTFLKDFQQFLYIVFYF